MKVIFLFLALVGLNCYGQFYQLDEAFSDDGVQYIPGKFEARSGLFYEGSYYFVGELTDLLGYEIVKVCKVNYDGTLATDFGNGGFVTVNVLPDSVVHGMKIFDGQIYVYGDAHGVNTSSYVDDTFVAKYSTAGVPDTSFGVNGVSIVDFGTDDYSLLGLIVQPNGQLYCVGSRRPYDSGQEDPRLIYCRMLPTGGIDLSFASNGYKMLSEDDCYGNEIFAYNDGFLLVGERHTDEPFTLPYSLLLAMIDADGNVVESFGTNGYQNLSFPDFLIMRDYDDIKMFDNKLYFTFERYSNNQYHKVAIYDIPSNQILTTVQYDERHAVDATQSGLWITSWDNSCNAPPCDNSFNLRRKTLEGVDDPTFLNAVYSYNSFTAPVLPLTPRAKATLVIEDPSGRVLMTGVADQLWGGAQGFALLRLRDSALGEVEHLSDSSSVYPNPFIGMLHFTLTQSIERIDIFDIAGRNVFSEVYIGGTNTASVDLSALATNSYIAKITTASGVVSKQIIKQ